MNATLEEYLAEHPADIIIATHIFPAEILTNMKQHGIRVPKNIFVATDYVCTPFTEETECDAYIIPTEDLASDFIGRGIQKERIYPFGIPTQGKFTIRESRDTVRQRLSLDTDKKYILITGGSMGGGKIGTAIAKLRDHFADQENTELIVVCGSNQD